MPRAFIALGSNVGDRPAFLEAAFNALPRLPQTRLIKRSSIYETPPVGPVAQGDFLNAAAELETTLPPKALFAELAKIEAAAGRPPRDRRPHWGPRTLDLDLLFYDQLVMREPTLEVPHPRLHERWFVLKPLADLDPAFVHPVLGKSVRKLLTDLEQSRAAEIGHAFSPVQMKTHQGSSEDGQ